MLKLVEEAFDGVARNAAQLQEQLQDPYAEDCLAVPRGQQRSVAAHLTF